MLGPCFGHERCDPETCKHPLSAQFCHTFEEPVLMLGKKAVEPPAPDGAEWGSKAYWWRLQTVFQTQCFACGEMVGEFRL